jgi:hypothetical protein
MAPLLAFTHLTRFAVCVGSVAWTSLLASPLVLTPGSYELTVQTLLPHLEENLRYATTRQQYCLGTQDATTLFPILRHAAFTGCALSGGQLIDGRLEYALACKNPQAASGVAHLSVSPARVDGVLEIKMGGKSMTLSQRIDGSRVGACQSGR